MFTVVINVYNRASLIEETLHSIFNQTQPAQEIVVVNDGSTDNSLEILEKYSDRIKLFTIENVGCGTSRKKAIEYSDPSIPWITFCDSDDLWKPNHLETIAALITDTPEASVVATDFDTFGKDENRGYFHLRSIPKKWWAGYASMIKEDVYLLPAPFLPLLEHNPLVITTMAIKRDIYEKCGGINESFSRYQAEDSDLTRRLALANHPFVLSLAHTVRLRRDGSNMSQSAAGNFLDRARISISHMNEELIPDKYSQKTHLFIQSSLEEAIRRLYIQDEPQKFELAYEAITPYQIKRSTRFRMKTRALPVCLRRMITAVLS
ncbi:glycosyltransferase family 2 protein [Temperatibacter marinus]|uniref:Glycosyltransferase family 2 protein n=1 Tax=Temperatibacter marinus TaxID=1456591 RepID=A0AA52EE00_9PROT|nr:glycosyltransferase family 2 protein [Temperatibacter marinus]WND02970.1 glycosyltransferase family 2 protein [Temperatibacter marinus]